MNVPKHKDLIYDVGMCNGDDSEFYLSKGFRVIAFEADPDLARSCRNRLHDFITNGQLVIVEGAIVEPDDINAGRKKVQFYKNEGVSEWGTVNANWATRNEEFGHLSNVIEVDVTDFSGVIQKYGMPYYMKIDIEGCDLICVNTLKRFSERPDYISIESDKVSFENMKRDIQLLMDLGYSSFQAVEQSQLHLIQSPPYPATEGKYVAKRFESGSSGLFGSELGENWKSKSAILWQYRGIWLGYYLLGDTGRMRKWKFRGASRLRELTRGLIRRFTKTAVPGWHDIHARLPSAEGSKVNF